ncbi:ANTAR domain-containing protein [Saccharothrix coeruleofusca]|uniref:Anti-anti-sigma factor n=1 Tax=Saccharothrix coeruleofusca TaxID=33919 RepID=A0A918ASV1_9PSEU|nr:ANTAR domain-containing protein [Saccharothrix coeruleofusca]MBP2336663.1 anti-anti-sigma factor [Saccharothrix coeruleofusca]GGP78882.1 hypothetical protein GCM10010185_60930 [Saccharothrix coeruleofusca]
MAFTSRRLNLRQTPSAHPAAEGVLVVIGEIDAEASTSFRTELTAFVGTQGGDVILDLSEVGLITAAGVRVLLEIADRLSGTARRLRLVASAEVRRVLRAVRVADVLETYDELDDAVGAQAAALRRTFYRAADSGVVDVTPDELHRLRREIGDLRAKLRTRPLLARALGVLQERYRLPDEDTARRLLREASQRYNLKMRMVAAAVLNAPPPATGGAALWFPHRVRFPAPATMFPASGRRRTHTLPSLLDAVLDTALTCTATAIGYLQLVDTGIGGLRLERYRGFTAELADLLAHVDGGSTSCALALERRTRVVFHDIADSTVLTSKRVQEVMLGAGIRAVQSTPLLAPSRRCLGVVSTCHTRAEHVPSAVERGQLDDIACQAGQWLEWHEQTTVLDALEDLHGRARAATHRNGQR